MSKIKTAIIFSIIFFGVLFFSSAQKLNAGDGSKIHWVSPTGTATWSNCESASDPGANYCSLSKANNNATAGDTIYLKGGTYTFNTSYSGAIHPVNSGTSGSKITFVKAPGETPTITTLSGTHPAAIQLEGVSYIKIDGITANNIYYWFFIFNGSHHNEITNCIFTNDIGAASDANAGSVIGGGGDTNFSTHNWIHGNKFSAAHGFNDDCGEGDELIRITTNLSGVGNDNYNTIEDNNLSYAGHAIYDGYGMYTVIRNNIAHNEPWRSGTGCVSPTYPPTYTNAAYTGKYGHRNIQISGDLHPNGIFNLVEGNRFGHASTNPNNDGADNLDIAGRKNIVRYNFLYNSMNDGLVFKYAASAWGGRDNRAYNNTIYHSGYGYAGSPSYSKRFGVYLYAVEAGSPATGNVIKNNLIYQSSHYDYGYADAQSKATFENNWCTSLDPSNYPSAGCTNSGDPKFVNPDLTAPTSSTLPNLALQPSSGAIDGGTYLTQASGSGSNSTTLVVQDALYFQDGTWGSDLARGVTLFPDWIAIGTVSNIVQISSINYGTNTITLASPMTWSNGASIWLYKKSDGAQVLYGSASDYGAYEYVEAVPPPDIPPLPPTGVTIQ